MNPLQRLALAFVAFFSVLFNRNFAEGVWQLRRSLKTGLPTGEASPIQADKPASAQDVEVLPVEPGAGKAEPRSALHLLAILQREGRFLDFIQEDVSAFSDAEIGAAARAVHGGCRKTVEAHFPLQPVLAEAEGAEVLLKEDFDRGGVQLTGNLAGDPPFRGHVCHRGWRVVEARLPEITGDRDFRIVAPAEVELP